MGRGVTTDRTARTGLRHGLAMLARAALDVVYPPLCMLCREAVHAPGSLCPACWSQLHFLDGPLCAACGLPFEIDAGEDTLCAACLAHPPAFDTARAVLTYDALSKKPVLAIKYADRLDFVPGFAHWLERAGHCLIADSDLVVPVPLHRKRLWTRRYNQAAELARALSQRCGLPMAPLALVRAKETPSQGTMPSAEARHRNVRGAFLVPKSERSGVTGRRVLLVDDVLTTGATANACARALKRAGAKAVYVLAVARVVRPLSHPI